MLRQEIKDLLQEGIVIPAHPLALNKERELDEKRQRLLTQYYTAAGAGGIAVGVHSTQFEIRDKDIQLFDPVLRIAAEEVKNAQLDRPLVKIAGVVGPTDQALREAEKAVSYDYDMALLSMGGLEELSEHELIRRAERVGEKIPLFGFYLQPAVGGRVLSFDFWKDFADLPMVHAIKIAPFNRYQTLDVVRAVCTSSRCDDIALYTGNDDNIIADLLTTYEFDINGTHHKKSIVGGLLGHWAVWTQKAVQQLEEIKKVKRSNSSRTFLQLMELGAKITDANAAIYDAANNFAGCIPGIHEILRRQGLLKGRWCLDTEEALSAGQLEEIERVHTQYPELSDDAFVEQFLQEDSV